MTVVWVKPRGVMGCCKLVVVMVMVNVNLYSSTVTKSLMH